LHPVAQKSNHRTDRAMASLARLAVLALATRDAAGVMGQEGGSQPREEMNAQCLLYRGDGCQAITDKATCLTSRDGRAFEYYKGRDARSQPCVWCGGVPCEQNGTAVCASYAWEVGNPVVQPPSSWISANCLDGRDLEESLARAKSRAPADVRASPDEFEPVNGGADQACRGPSLAGRVDEVGRWSYSMWSAASLEDCMALCGETCAGVEYKRADRYCEVWGEAILGSAPLPGFSCHRKKSSQHWKPPPLPEEAMEARDARLTQDAAKAKPPVVASPAALGAGPVGHVDRDVAEWPAPHRMQHLAEPGGRFVKGDGSEGSGVFWQDASGKRPLPSGVRCSECGCDGENVYVLPQVEVDAMPMGETFHCIAVEPPAPTPIPPSGRFVIVDEEVPVGNSSEFSVRRRLYWQNFTGMVHPVPEGYDCSSCGCEQPVRVARKVVRDLPLGVDFHCGMSSGRLLLLPVHTAGAIDAFKGKCLAAAGLVLLMAALACLTMRAAAPPQQKATRAVNLDADEESMPLKSYKEEEVASSAPLMSSFTTFRVAPPVYVIPTRKPEPIMLPAAAPIALPRRLSFSPWPALVRAFSAPLQRPAAAAAPVAGPSAASWPSEPVTGGAAMFSSTSFLMPWRRPSVVAGQRPAYALGSMQE